MLKKIPLLAPNYIIVCNQNYKMDVISFLYELLFDSKGRKKKRNNPELFHTDDFLRPHHPNPRICPKCNAQAETNKDAAEIFGLRNINGRYSIQSWCTRCRNSNVDCEELNKNKQEEIKV